MATPTRFDSLLLGAWLALRPDDARGAHPFLLPALIAVLGLVFRLASNPVLDPWILSIGFTVIGLVALLLLHSSLGDGIVARICRVGWLRQIGQRSDSMYLFHQKVIFLVLGIFTHVGVAAAMIATLLTYAVAELTWRTIESPALALKRRFPRGSASGRVTEAVADDA